MVSPILSNSPFMLHKALDLLDAQTLRQDVETTIQEIRSKTHSAYELLEIFTLARSLFSAPLMCGNEDITRLTDEIAQALAKQAHTCVKPDPSPEEIRSYLQAEGCLPSLEEANAIFWSLGEEWWKQIIDGSDHKHGPWVFDKGLHGNGAEPGYLEGIKKGSEYFTKQFNASFTLDLYRGIHYIACEHFRGPSNGTSCTFEEIDHFRTKTIRCQGWNLSEAWKAHKMAASIRQEMRKMQQRLELEKPFGSCTVTNSFIEVWYLDYESEEECRTLTSKIINEFNRQLHTLQKETYAAFLTLTPAPSLNNLFGRMAYRNSYRSKAEELIAALFATLDGVHPWRDGQGRTDLISMNGLLCREGSHPTILHDPYVSTYEPQRWPSAFRRGLTQFETLLLEKVKERSKANTKANTEASTEAGTKASTCWLV